MNRLLCGIGAGLMLASVGVAHADPWSFGGHLKLQLSQSYYRSDDLAALYAGREPTDSNLDFRLKAERHQGPWETIVHYEILGVGGDSLSANRALAAIYPILGAGVSADGLPNDKRRLLDLTETLTDANRSAAVQRLDRLSLGYLGENDVIRVGRQAVSWGDGLVFNPMDIFNPFSPVAIDKEYKTGDDMVYGQRLFASGADLQAIVLPRRNPASGRVEGDQSSYALKYRCQVSGADLNLLGAHHFGENLLGAGWVQNVGGAVWRTDVVVTELEMGGHATSAVTNADYSWTAFGRNWYGYVEYFRNGFGETNSANYLTPNAELAARIGRGELYTLGRDYLAAGFRVESTPLVNIYAGLIRNLHDASGYFQPRIVYDWQENLQLMVGLSLPFGARGSEFGGIPVSTGGPYITPAKTVYVRAGYYF